MGNLSSAAARCGFRYFAVRLADRGAGYVSTGGLGCRGCFRLTYQSKCETWDWPIAEAVDKRVRNLAREPGPKGSRYRAWERRALRISNLAGAMAW